ncbi:MAG: twin-arginine translocase TatA/TatE family subunit [Syntrophomonas sp.]
MGNIGPWELVLILFIALVIFGPGKLPEVAKGMGKAVRDFKQASTSVEKQFQEVMKAEAPEDPVIATMEDKVTVDKEHNHPPIGTA